MRSSRSFDTSREATNWPVCPGPILPCTPNSAICFPYLRVSLLLRFCTVGVTGDLSSVARQHSSEVPPHRCVVSACCSLCQGPGALGGCVPCRLPGHLVMGTAERRLSNPPQMKWRKCQERKMSQELSTLCFLGAQRPPCRNPASGSRGLTGAHGSFAGGSQRGHGATSVQNPSTEVPHVVGEEGCGSLPINKRQNRFLV